MARKSKSKLSELYPEENKDQIYENALAEIQSFELPLGTTLRSVYDDQPNAHQRFMEKLDACIRNHDREIEKMCNFHHQGFVDAITELLKVRADAEKLKVIAQTEEIIRCRVQQRNITTVVEKLQLCLPVLEMYSKLKEQMNVKSMYPSVMKFALHPSLLVLLLKQAQQQKTFSTALQKQNNVNYGRNMHLGRSRILESKNEMTLKRTFEEDDEHEEEILTAQDLVDFSPVYRCLHIYSVLGDGEIFENYYRKQRRKQARLVLQPQSSMHETVEGYRRYFSQIVGDPDLVLELKNLIVVFADTLQGYGFPVNRLFDLLFEIRDQYNETLLKKWSGLFRDIFEADNYSPIPVANEEEYKIVTSKFPFQDPELDKQSFPKKLPMSQSVPQIYIQVKEFIYASLKFSESLHRSSTEIDDMLRKATNLLLTRTLSSCLQNLIKKPHIGLTELVQIIINTTHLEQACKYLEDFISNITNISQVTVHTARLYGLSTFKDARHAAEGEIYTKLNQKIDEFIQIADYDWTMSESDGRASGYLMDLINFLRSTFQVFTHLPGKVAQTACMSACQHLSTSLMQMLLDSELKQISMGAIQQFNLDVIQCELFASSEPVPGFQGDTLQLAFIDLRQVRHYLLVFILLISPFDQCRSY
ncbi:exocyst complex component 6 isoform x2 [Limosa lapponica baueri]|uniref:Exocyst complex component n=1 Tax=Limosa lapponica baueri TaxID=1758121 RepID=A0A2I0U7U6_LIMLA|nr:exocyst complex component 6 isoform x2 [Limosa lapponica baueri]